MSNASPGRPVEGRVPPHNVQAEETLGAMLLKQSAISESVQSVNTGDFYKPAHADIYDAISTLYAAGEPVDPVTVAAELKRAGSSWARHRRPRGAALDPGVHPSNT